MYRALQFLQSQGLVHRLESLNAYVGCVHPEHPHASQFLICRDCGQVEELAHESTTTAERQRQPPRQGRAGLDQKRDDVG